VSEGREHQPAGRRIYRVAGLSSQMASATHVDDLAAGYALGALDADEAQLVDAHVRGCASCEHALGEAQRTVSMLPFLVSQQAPPVDAKVALFARVAHAQKAAVVAALPTANIEHYRSPSLPASDPANDLVMPPVLGATGPSVEVKRESRSGWLISVVSLPLLVALVATGFWGLQLRNQLTAQSSMVAELQSELTNFGSGTTSYQLSPGMAAPQAEGQIVMGADQRAGMLQIDVNSKDGPASYEMWVNQDGELHPVSEVTVNQDGQGQARFELDQPFTEYESIHIKAKPVATGIDSSLDDALFQDSEGSLGSTGSGLDFGP
jgi:Putative zinc-finger